MTRKLTDSEVYRMRCDHARSTPIRELAERYDVARTTAYRAVAGVTHIDAGGPLAPPRPPPKPKPERVTWPRTSTRPGGRCLVLTEFQLRGARLLRRRDEPYHRIAALCRVSTSTMWRALTRGEEP